MEKMKYGAGLDRIMLFNVKVADQNDKDPTLIS